VDQQTSHELHALCEEKREIKLKAAALKTQEALVNNEIIKLVGKLREGSQSLNNGVFKVTTTGKMNRKVLPDELAEIHEHIPDELSPFEFKPSINLKKLRALELANPELHRFCCRAIEEKEGTTAVKVELADA